jgi:hypothetical protein
MNLNIMTQIRTISIFLALTLITLTSCEKSIEVPDSSMIYQLSDEDQFRSPLSFEFDENDHLIRLEYMFMFAAVEYDLEGRPNRIYRDFGEVDNNSLTDVVWNDEGFAIGGTYYVINEDKILTKTYRLAYIGSTEEDTSYCADYNYYGNDSLIVEEQWSDQRKQVCKYYFNDMLNPFSNVNMAVIKVIETSFNGSDKGPFYYGHGKYAISKYINESGETFTVNYDLNDLNQLEKATIFENGQAVDHVYYKYELL